MTLHTDSQSLASRRAKKVGFESIKTNEVSVTINITHRDNWVTEMQPVSLKLSLSVFCVYLHGFPKQCGSLTVVSSQLTSAFLLQGGWTRIVTNLVGNALKYTLDGQISIRLEDLGSSSAETGPVQLVVEDTGIGMSESFITHSVFMPYKQVLPCTTRLRM